MSGTDVEARVYFGFRSPYSRLGLHRLARADAAARPGLKVMPFTGPPEGVPFTDPVQNPLKRAYYNEDAPRATRAMGLPIRSPEPFDVDWAPANRAAIAAEAAGCGLAFALAVSDARWGEGRDISDMTVLEDAAARAGWDAAAVGAAQSELDVKTAAKAQRAFIEGDGVFGVPFAVLETRKDEKTRTQKFWGQDRFDLFLERWAAALDA